MKNNVIGCMTLLCSSLAFSDHAWNNYHWQTGDNLAVIDSITLDWRSELDESLLRWNQSEVLNIAVIQVDNSEETRAVCPLENGAIRVCAYTYGNTDWLGLTTVGVDSTGHVDRAVARINLSYSSYWGNQVYRNKVVCHEIGHTFGLGHTSTDGTSQGTCMDYSFTSASQWPNAHDYEQLLEIYTHEGGGDPGTDPEPPKCKGKNCDGTPDNGGKGGGKGKNRLDVDEVKVPPAGIRVTGAAWDNHEVWIAPRVDGGLWIHYVWLVDEVNRE